MAEHIVDLRLLQEQLAAPFEADEVKWRAIVTSKDGTKAMCSAYLEARTIMDRLDEVVGAENWKDDYVFRDNGTVICHLSLCLDGEWTAKCDVGAPSEQPDANDRDKAAVTDALKRCAVKWGIGRFLHRLPKQWVKYDAQKKQLLETPRLPAWALPAQQKAPPPKQEAPRQETPRPDEKADRLTDEQIQDVLALAKEAGVTPEKICAAYGGAGTIFHVARVNYPSIIARLKATIDQKERETVS